MNKTNIEWTDYTWNPVTGCQKVSTGCKNCYAETQANRFWGERKFTDVQMHENRLLDPVTYQKLWAGKKVFVCSMSDLFHESVSFNFIARIWRETFSVHRDTRFQILTKRPARALDFFHFADKYYKPLPNVWIGVSCEDQKTADERIPLLLEIPAAVHFLSCEPLLGPIDLTKIKDPRQSKALISGAELDWFNAFHSSVYMKGIDWVIAGGESGHHARPMHPDWVRSLRDQCEAANVSFFFKQWGAYKYLERFPFPVQDLQHVKYHWQQLHKPDDGFKRIAKKSPASVLQNWPLAVRTKKSEAGALLDGVAHRAFPSSSLQPIANL